MTIKEAIIESGRYNEILDIVNELLVRSCDYPISTTIDDRGNVLRWISPKAIAMGVLAWQDYIETTGEYPDSVSEYMVRKEKLYGFSLVVENALEVLLHNYANSCAHRNIPDESDLEVIRAYEILNSSIYAILSPFYDPETGEFDPWTVSEGWKKL